MPRRCPKCNSFMELRINRLLAPPELGTGFLVWYCPNCGYKERLIAP